MGVYIKGMEMPTEGYVDLRIKCDGTASHCTGEPPYITTYEVTSVPPHGKLGDLDALLVEINTICDRRDAGIISDLTCLQQILSAVSHAPTIIPAEE